MKIFEIKNCRKKFEGKEVLKGINISLEEGKILSIIGSSGGGKSTLLRIFTFLESMDDGVMYFRGEKIYEAKDGKYLFINKKLQKEVIEDTGLVFQNFNLFPHMTVLDNLIDAPIVVKKRDKKEVIEEAKEILKKVGLEHKINSYPGGLSGGEKQRVAIARVLMMKPEIIFFDEPTSALDPELTKDVLKVIKLLAKEKYTMIIVTHEMKFAEEVSDEVIFLDKGKIEVSGKSSEVFTNTNNERLKKFLDIE